MKQLRLQFPALVMAFALAILSGCVEKKKPVLVVPPPPAAAPQPTPSPTPEETQPSDTSPQEQAAAPVQEPPLVKPTPAKPKRRATTKKPNPPANEKNPTETARNTPKTIINQEKTEPPLTPGQLAPGPTPADTRDQGSTEQLLQTAEQNLNNLKRQLSQDEENMRAQIKEFISQSRKATTENDPARAHTLAVKARLLSDELVKQR